MVELPVEQKVKLFFDKYPSQGYKKGDIVIQVGNDKKIIHYIERGHIRQFGITKEGEDVTLNIFKPGAFFPMAWVVNNYVNTYSFAAMDEVTVRKAEFADVVTFLKNEPEVLFDLLKRIYIGLEGTLFRLEQMMSGNAKKQLVNILIICAKRFGVLHDNVISIQLKLTHQDLATLTGLTRETVSREMAQLKQQGVIDYSNIAITIKNMNTLENTLL